jgi:hypothetical protein
LFTNIVYSSQSDFETNPRNCSYTWGSLCNLTTTNDAFPPCNGIQTSANAYVSEVYINATDFFPNTGINVTCAFSEVVNYYNFEYIWYYDSSNWYKVYQYNSTQGSIRYRNVTFNVNSTEGTHIVRCIISFNSTTGPQVDKVIPTECANSSYSVYYDNDDVNFTVTPHLIYSSWNLTNYTSSEAGSGGNYSRTIDGVNAALLNISAYWNKQISYAVIEHNGTGTWENYTISSYTGNWTNYTLDLSNATLFNNRVIAVRSIYVNDTYGVLNNTSPSLYFYLAPGTPPTVTNQNFYYAVSNIGGNSNLFDEDRYIKANVTDDVGLSSVIARISYPNGTNINVSMTGINNPGHNESWSFNFNNTFPLNETGYYNASVIAIDIGGQEYASENISLFVNKSYILQSLPYSKYNRGEFVNITVMNIRQDTNITDGNWTINLTKFGSSQLLLNGTNSRIFFNISSSDPTGNYSVFVNVTKLGNSATGNYEFNVSDNLIINFTQPAQFSEYTVDTSLVGFSSNMPIVNVSYARNQLLDYNVNVTLQCPNGNFTLGKTGQSYYNLSAICQASSSAGFFFLTVNASDNYGNSGNATLNLTAKSSGGNSETIIVSGGGGGGGGGGGNITIIQNVTVNTTQSSRDFNFTLSPTSVEIEQGQDATILGSLFNIGNQPLVLNATLESKCCNITLPKGFELAVKKETAFSINVHVPLFQELGEYVVNITISTANVAKEKAFKIIVKKGTSINSLNELETKLSNLESQVKEYEKLGINVNDLKNMIEQTKQLLSGGKSSINRDSSANLRNSLDNANKILSSLSSKLPALGVQKFLQQNKYNISLAITTLVLTTYTATQIVLPYHKLSQELKFLTEEEAALVQSRVDAEKQYFRRTINEQTFTNIMITKQEKVLKTRAMLKLKQEEKAGLVRSRLSPKALARWIKNGSINTFYAIKSSPRTIVDKIKNRVKKEEVKFY